MNTKIHNVTLAKAEDNDLFCKRGKMKTQTYKPLSSIYRREEDFSSDIARHISLLSVGDFEDAETESNVGTRKADIVAVGNDGILVIENQFGKADWDHWGRLEAYARLKEANVAMLIAEKFEELMIVTCNHKKRRQRYRLVSGASTGKRT